MIFVLGAVKKKYRKYHLTPWLRHRPATFWELTIIVMHNDPNRNIPKGHDSCIGQSPLRHVSSEWEQYTLSTLFHNMSHPQFQFWPIVLHHVSLDFRGLRCRSYGVTLIGDEFWTRLERGSLPPSKVNITPRRKGWGHSQSWRINLRVINLDRPPLQRQRHRDLPLASFLHSPLKSNPQN